MTDDVVLLYGETRLPADDCKVIFKDRFKKEHEIEISRLIRRCSIIISGKTKRV